MQSSVIAYLLFATLVAVECLSPLDMVKPNSHQVFTPAQVRDDTKTVEDNSIKTEGGDLSTQSGDHHTGDTTDCGGNDDQENVDEYYPEEQYYRERTDEYYYPGQPQAQERQFNNDFASDDFFDYELSPGTVDSNNYDGDYFGPADSSQGFSDYGGSNSGGAFDDAAYDYDYAGDGGFDADYPSGIFRSSVGDLHGPQKKK